MSNGACHCDEMRSPLSKPKHKRDTSGIELVELSTRAAAHDTTGGAAVGQDKKQDKARTQNGEHAGERQMVTA